MRSRWLSLTSCLAAVAGESYTRRMGVRIDADEASRVERLVLAYLAWDLEVATAWDRHAATLKPKPEFEPGDPRSAGFLSTRALASSIGNVLTDRVGLVCGSMRDRCLLRGQRGKIGLGRRPGWRWWLTESSLDRARAELDQLSRDDPEVARLRRARSQGRAESTAPAR